MLLTLVCTALFAAAATLAIGTIVGTLRRYGAQALAVVEASRAVADVREFRVVLTAPQSRGATVWPQLRRRPHRPGVRVGVVRSGEAKRAAA